MCIRSTQITPSRQHYLYYFFFTAWITSKLFGTCCGLIWEMVQSTAFCMALTAWTNTSSPGEIRSSGASGSPGGLEHQEQAWSGCVGWNRAYSLMDQNGSPKGKSAIRHWFVWFYTHIFMVMNSICAFVQSLCYMGLPQEVFVVTALCHFSLACLYCSFSLRFPQMHYQYKHGALHLLSVVWASRVNSHCG